MTLFARLSTTRSAWRGPCHLTRGILGINTLPPKLHQVKHATGAITTRALTSAPSLMGSHGGGAADSTDANAPSTATAMFEYSAHFSSPLPTRYAQLQELAAAEFPSSFTKSVSPVQAQLLRMLMRMTRPKAVLELGCFMGYSAMALADGLGPDSVVYTCEKDEKAANLARKVFEEYNYTRSEYQQQQEQAQGGDHVKHRTARIELLEGDAMDSLKALAQNNMEFDAIFIDADKGNYIHYYDFILENKMLSRQGFILADNVLFRGLVLNSEEASAETPFFTTSSSSVSPSRASRKLEKYIDKVEEIEKAQEQEEEEKEMKKKEEEKKEAKQKVAKLSKEERAVANAQKAADHMHRFNSHVLNDGRVEVVVLPLFDGLSIIRRVDYRYTTHS